MTREQFKEARQIGERQMTKIEIEIRCKDREQAAALTEKVMNGDHHIGRKHGAWYWFCSCDVSEILHLGQELHYELDDCE